MLNTPKRAMSFAGSISATKRQGKIAFYLAEPRIEPGFPGPKTTVLTTDLSVRPVMELIFAEYFCKKCGNT